MEYGVWQRRRPQIRRREASVGTDPVVEIEH
jgi:hypothetical protein